MEITSLILIINGIANLVLGFLIYIRNRDDIINILYAILAANLAIWSFSIFYFRVVEDVNLFWSRIAYLSAGTTALLFVYFTIYFPFKTKINSLWHIFFITYYLILVVLIVGTRSVLEKYIRTDHTHGLLFGKGYILYIFLIFIFFGFGFYNLIKKYYRSTGITQTQIRYVLIGGFITTLTGTFTNLVIFGGGIFAYNWLGPSSAIFLVIFFAYAITKYHLFEIRVILTEMLVGAIAFILLIQAFSAETLLWRVFGFILLGLFGIVGYFLIKSVLKEIELRGMLERVNAELERANIELQKLDKAKSEFLSIASHQLRTPLGIIKGYLSMILDKSYGKVPKELKKPLQNAYTSNRGLVKLVDDLLDVSKIEAGKMELELEEVSLEDMISDMITGLRMKAKNKKLYLKFEKPKIPLPKISIDFEKIKNVVMNVIDNAIKYTKKGGVTVALKNLGAKIQIMITDTGPGLEEDEIEKIFKPLTRGAAGTESGGGAGLGLYVARKFIEIHGGKIWAQSEGKSKGSTFVIELPIR